MKPNYFRWIVQFLMGVTAVTLAIAYAFVCAFVYLEPTLPMFLSFPWLHDRIGFWPTLAACALLTIACFAATAWIVRGFGIELLP